MKQTFPFQSRPLSWSAMSSFRYSPEQWARKYLDGTQDPANKEMLYGNEIGTRLATDPTFLPEVTRYDIFEKKLTARINDIELIGFFDSFKEDATAFAEYKTSSNPKKWTQKSAEDHGQLLFYKFLIWKNYGIPPEQVDCTLFYIPVRETPAFGMELAPHPVKAFKVRKTAVDVLNFANYIKDTYAEMYEYAIHRQGLTP